MLLESTVLRTAIVTLGKAAVDTAISSPEIKAASLVGKATGSPGLDVAVAVLKVAIFLVLL